MLENLYLYTVLYVHNDISTNSDYSANIFSSDGLIHDGRFTEKIS